MANENTTYINYLIDMSQSGRQRGFLELCEINMRNVFTVVYRLLGDIKAAKKITVKTFLTAWGEIKEFPRHKPFLQWIKGMAINFAMDELEEADKNRNTKLSAPTDADEVEFLGYQIKQLPLLEKTVFILHDLEGYSYSEIQTFFPNLIEDELKTILIQTRQQLISKLNL